MNFAQYYEPHLPVPPQAQLVLDKIAKLCEEFGIEPDEIHASYMIESRKWAIGSNYERDWDSLIYSQDGNWFWRDPWDGSDRPTSTNEPDRLAVQFVGQIVDMG